MPNSRDAARRHRQSQKRKMRNQVAKSAVHTSIKILRAALKGKDEPGAVAHYASFVKLIDTATQKGIYHKNAAARKKARLYRALAQRVS